MVQGFERREVLQKQQQAVQPDSIPLAPVMAPQPASFAKVGEDQRVLSSLLNRAGGMFDAYVEKKRSTWELDGKMAYMAGKTEQEIRNSGNKYTTQGFMTMKARVAANEWEQTELKNIADSAHTLDPDAYRGGLSKTYADLVEKTAGADKYTRELLGAIAEETFPRLVNQQMVSNNAYREQETYGSYVNLVVSESGKFDPANPDAAANLQQLLDPSMSGLPDKLHKKAVIEAVAMTQEQDNDFLVQAIGGPTAQMLTELNKSAGLPEGLLPAVMKQESGGRRYNADGTILKGPVTKSGERAEGEMQVMPYTQADPGYGVMPAKDDSAEEKFRVGKDYLGAMYKEFNGNTEQALVAYNWGPGNAKDWIAAGADPSKLPKETQKYVKNIMGSMGKDSTMSTASMTQSLIQQGFDPSEIRTVQRSMEARSARKENAFSEQRFAIEQSLAETAKETGNMEMAIGLIQDAAKQGGYSDSWVNARVQDAQKGVAEYEKKQIENIKVDNALATGALASLSPTEQDLAYSRARAKMAAELAASGAPADQIAAAVDKGILDISVRTNTVDGQLKAQMSAALLGSLTDSEGKIKPSVEQAYMNFKHLYDVGGAELAKEYAGDGSALLYEALTFDAGGESSAAALLVAEQAMKNRKDNGGDFKVTDTISPTLIDKTIDRFGVGWLEKRLPDRFVSDAAARGRLELRAPKEDDLDKLRNNVVLKNQLRARATSLKGVDPSRSDESVVREAYDQVMKNVELVGSNVLFGGTGRTIRQAMGVNDGRDNVAHVAVADYLDDFGPEFWSDYNKFDIWHPIESIGDKIRGVPDFTATYNPDSESFVIDLYKNAEYGVPKEARTTTGKKLVVPAKVIGDYYKVRSFKK